MRLVENKKIIGYIEKGEEIDSISEAKYFQIFEFNMDTISPEDEIKMGYSIKA